MYYVARHIYTKNISVWNASSFWVINGTYYAKLMECETSKPVIFDDRRTAQGWANHISEFGIEVFDNMYFEDL